MDMQIALFIETLISFNRPLILFFPPDFTDALYNLLVNVLSVRIPSPND